jgi:hypothetical protein
MDSDGRHPKILQLWSRNWVKMKRSRHDPNPPPFARYRGTWARWQIHHVAYVEAGNGVADPAGDCGSCVLPNPKRTLLGHARPRNRRPHSLPKLKPDIHNSFCSCYRVVLVGCGCYAGSIGALPVSDFGCVGLEMLARTADLILSSLVSSIRKFNRISEASRRIL